MLGSLIITFVAYGQDPTPPAFGDDVTDLVPLDGGLSILVAAGISLGAKKAYDYSRNRKD